MEVSGQFHLLAVYLRGMELPLRTDWRIKWAPESALAVLRGGKKKSNRDDSMIQPIGKQLHTLRYPGLFIR
jgi:hypothetical protein